MADQPCAQTKAGDHGRDQNPNTAHAINCEMLCGEQGAHVHIGFFRAGEFKQASGAKPEQARNNIVRKLLNANVVNVDAFVVELAPIGDRVFQVRNTRLQM